MVLSDPEEKIADLWSRIEHLARIRLSVSPIFQVAAARSLHYDCTNFCASVKSHRDFCVDYLQDMGISMTPPQGTPYGFPSISKDDWAFVWRLLNRGVLTTPGSSYGPVIGPGHFRFVFLQQSSVLKKAFDIIHEVLHSWR
jgi:aspartate/methionine/tyrosine aminotransferase